MNVVLATLILQLASYLKQITRDLRDKKKSVTEWQSDFLRLLAQYLMLAMMRGVDSDTLTSDQEAFAAQALREQAQYLNGFADDYLQTGWLSAYEHRAGMYAESLRRVFWQGETECLHLPILPGSPELDCGQFCRCHLEIKWLDRELCSADVYWRLTNDLENSPDCVRLAEEWNPLRVRGGVIQNEKEKA